MNQNELLKTLVKALKAAKQNREEIFDKLQTAQSALAKATKYPEAFSRKVFKSPSMLVANYGAKLRTTSDSVKETLLEVAPELLNEFTKEEENMFYRLVHLQVGITFPASNNYLNWSNKLFNLVAKKRDGIAYNNPLTGFPVNVREYKTEQVKVNYRVFGKVTATKLKLRTKEINAQSTSTTATPICIHSLDAAVLHNTKLRLNKPMALVHDSFGVKPNDLDDLTSSVNLTLLEVAEADVLTNITNQLTVGCEEEIKDYRKRTGINLLNIPYQGTVAKDNLAKVILNSEYAFS
ncbi:DNA-directed RNA polymerase [Shewanella oncorhynchi]|uniref:DNA-directed RNA polymerase n=1 Tax=Shewanella oncorhynchi TaxID=2726434 RepID=A0AA50KFN4_9GAMM|nr:DNA-directed RNA polymerase [Shewanella oncorhynchi]WMB74210.1 DNA-directed RNA polymerase [Shewanella oncorhynchi]